MLEHLFHSFFSRIPGKEVFNEPLSQFVLSDQNNVFFLPGVKWASIITRSLPIITYSVMAERGLNGASGFAKAGFNRWVCAKRKIIYDLLIRQLGDVKRLSD